VQEFIFWLYDYECDLIFVADVAFVSVMFKRSRLWGKATTFYFGWCASAYHECAQSRATL